MCRICSRRISLISSTMAPNPPACRSRSVARKASSSRGRALALWTGLEGKGPVADRQSIHSVAGSPVDQELPHLDVEAGDPARSAPPSVGVVETRRIVVRQRRTQVSDWESLVSRTFYLLVSRFPRETVWCGLGVAFQFSRQRTLWGTRDAPRHDSMNIAGRATMALVDVFILMGLENRCRQIRDCRPAAQDPKLNTFAHRPSPPCAEKIMIRSKTLSNSLAHC